MSKNRRTKVRVSTGYAVLIALLITAGVVGLGSLLLNQKSAQAADIVVYKSPTCGCCKKWVSHLEQHGYTVEVHNQSRNKLSSIKAEMGVPRGMQSCHTAKIGGYVIEGHVPADEIARLLKEKPQIKGLVVPGMPMGSPGMEGPKQDSYDVLALQENGETSIFASK
jgi:hypothetical protein